MGFGPLSLAFVKPKQASASTLPSCLTGLVPIPPLGLGPPPYPLPLSWPCPKPRSTSISSSTHHINKETCYCNAFNCSCIVCKVLCTPDFDKPTKDLSPPHSLCIHTVPTSRCTAFVYWPLLLAILLPIAPPLNCSLGCASTFDFTNASIYD